MYSCNRSLCPLLRMRELTITPTLCRVFTSAFISGPLEYPNLILNCTWIIWEYLSMVVMATCKRPLRDCSSFSSRCLWTRAWSSSSLTLSNRSDSSSKCSPLSGCSSASKGSSSFVLSAWKHWEPSSLEAKQPPVYGQMTSQQKKTHI